MQSWEKGFSATITREGKNTFSIRYKCPWCAENSNVAAAHAVPFPGGHAAFLVVCDGNQCRRPSMVTARIHQDSIIGEHIYVEELHPNPRVRYEPDGVPEDIAADFEEALNCAVSGFKLGAAVVGRRALQAALVDKGATQRDLVDQINEVPDDVLPRQLKLAALHVRLIGNDAAHVRGVSSEDVLSLTNFVDLVLQQVYILPHEIAQQTRTIQPQHMPGAAPPGGPRRGRGNRQAPAQQNPAPPNPSVAPTPDPSDGNGGSNAS